MNLPNDKKTTKDVALCEAQARWEAKKAKSNPSHAGHHRARALYFWNKADRLAGRGMFEEQCFSLEGQTFRGNYQDYTTYKEKDHD